MIYHILPREAYEALSDTEPYKAETLETEGFIHCSAEPNLLLVVANRFYKQITGPFVVLCIDENRIASIVRWEESDDNIFPHIYGPLNWDAVEKVIDFPRDGDGTFLLPVGLP